jgi:hypothetical protein
MIYKVDCLRGKRRRKYVPVASAAASMLQTLFLRSTLYLVSRPCFSFRTGLVVSGQLCDRSVRSVRGMDAEVKRTGMYLQRLLEDRSYG